MQKGHKPTHKVSILVHGGGESVQVSVSIVHLHIRLVRSPDIETHHLLFVAGILLAVSLGRGREGERGGRAWPYGGASPEGRDEGTEDCGYWIR